MAKTSTFKQKLVCPYCEVKQAYKASDYFYKDSVISHNLQCDACDLFFNAQITGDNEVTTFTNGLLTI